MAEAGDDRFAEALRGFGPAGVIAIFILVWVGAAFDVAAILIIYWNAESDVAHLIFSTSS